MGATDCNALAAKSTTASRRAGSDATFLCVHHGLVLCGIFCNFLIQSQNPADRATHSGSTTARFLPKTVAMGATDCNALAAKSTTASSRAGSNATFLCVHHCLVLICSKALCAP